MWPYSADRPRAMYTGGRADPTARRFARFWAVVFALGLLPRRWVTLEVRGQRRPCLLVEVSTTERAPILKRYLPIVPGAPLAEFAAIAPRYPVFRVDPRPPADGHPKEAAT